MFMIIKHLFLPYTHTFPFTKQSDFKKASGIKVLKFRMKFQQALKPNHRLKAFKCHIKIIHLTCILYILVHITEKFNIQYNR